MTNNSTGSCVPTDQEVAPSALDSTAVKTNSDPFVFRAESGAAAQSGELEPRAKSSRRGKVTAVLPWPIFA